MIYFVVLKVRSSSFYKGFVDKAEFSENYINKWNMFVEFINTIHVFIYIIYFNEFSSNVWPRGLLFHVHFENFNFEKKRMRSLIIWTFFRTQDQWTTRAMYVNFTTVYMLGILYRIFQYLALFLYNCFVYDIVELIWVIFLNCC